MKEKKAVELILAARKKARIVGGVLFAFIILAGILCWIFWKWYALVIVVGGLLFTSIYSLLQAKRIARQTGLTFDEQDRLLKKHQ
jgi:4-hydroxybenzoate polyprenyltransferase